MVQWFAALHDGHKAKAIKAVTGESNEFSLTVWQNSNITHFHTACSMRAGD